MHGSSRLVIATHVLLIPAVTLSQPTVEWSRGFGGTLDDESCEVAVDAQYNVYVTGIFRGTVNFGSGPIVSDGLADIFLLRLDASGSFVRADVYGSTGDDVVCGVGVDQSGNTYLAGSFSGTIDFGGGPLASVGPTDMFLASFDSQGNHRWSKRFTSSQEEIVADLAVAPDGTSTLVGGFLGTIDFGGGPIATEAFCTDAFLARFDPDGNHVWTQSRGEGPCGGTSVDYWAVGISLGASGYGCISLANYFCSLDCTVGASAEEFDPAGNPLGRFGGGYCRDVEIAPMGGFYVCGNYEFEDFRYQFVARFSDTHTRLWRQSYDNFTPNGFFYFGSLSVDIDESVVVVGDFQSTIDLGDGLMTSAGNSDIFALHLSPAGDQPETYQIGGTGRDVPSSIVRAEDGAFLIIGEFADQVDIGDESLTSAGGSDVLVTKIRFRDKVAVAISEFHAKSSDGVVVLEGRFQSDLDVVALNVYRALETNPEGRRQIASINDRVHEIFQFVDRSVEPGNSYRYQISVVDADGEFFSDFVTVAVAAVNSELLQNRPNPFNPTTSIRFSLSKSERVILSVFDGNGRRVRTLLDGVRSHGPHEITWDGRDDSGAQVSSGVYFYRLTAGSFIESKKMVLLK